MGVKINSTGGGSVTLDAPSTASNLTVTLPSTSGTLATTDGGNTTFTSITDSGNLTFTGTGNRITGDFSNATFASRVAFQTSTANANTSLSVLPNGTGTTSQVQMYGASDPTNTSRFTLNADTLSGYCLLSADKTGTGTFLPMTFYTGGSERMRIDTSGNVGIGTNNPTYALTIGDSTTNSNIAPLNAQFSSNTAVGFNLTLRKSNDGANTPGLGFAKSRGTAASPTIVQSGDGCGSIAGYAYDGVTYQGAAQIRFDVDGTPGAGDMPGRIVFNTTPDGSSTLTERMRIDSSGNVGVGVTPSAWGSAGKAIDLYPTGAVAGYTGGVRLFGNAYDNGSGYTYKSNGYATLYSSTGGMHSFYTAPSGSAGGAVSWTEYVRVATDGRVFKFGDSGSARILPGTDNVGYIGDSGYRWQAIYAVNGTIQTSDGRQKNSVEDSNLGLSFVNSLRPVSYKWNVGENIVTYDENGNEVVTPRPGVRNHYGFIAQEVKAAIPEGVDFGGFVQEPNDGDMALRYHEFIAPMVKAIQELKAELDELKAKVN